MSPRPFTKSKLRIRRDFSSNHHNTALSIYQMCGSNRSFTVNAKRQTPIFTAEASNRSDDSEEWKINDIGEKTCAVLTCTSHKASVDFRVTSHGNTPQYSITRGNAFMNDASEAGMWTLMRAQSKNCGMQEPVALIHVAGPYVACCDLEEMPLALAIANAMYSTILAYKSAWKSMMDDVSILLRKTSTSKVQSGAGFFVSGSGASCPLTQSIKGTPKNDWLCEHTYLRRTMMTSESSDDGSGVSMLLGELGWAGGLTGIF
eukprot:CAMPEP_0181296216 /NCGR_PEP_ID=MMETSP1101-20121128/4577_1 /TAXON_ID=46948 /ORGANISM="Rhodomonas abbreviata, Strain Caron Lab Isolate" /LENGTH=259 /DNA_ID=CAMNT_0023401049 /DNA_START=558 /DNA_END=1334 /DNA_ORIENTATION=+